MVEIQDDFFEKVLSTVNQLDQHIEEVGTSLIEGFRLACMDFEPVSHFNIKVYFQYQLLEGILMRLGSKISKDEISQRIADKLLGSLSNKNNPMSFIHSDWNEFNYVPNYVMNKNMNKCIDITK